MYLRVLTAGAVFYHVQAFIWFSLTPLKSSNLISSFLPFLIASSLLLPPRHLFPNYLPLRPFLTSTSLSLSPLSPLSHLAAIPHQPVLTLCVCSSVVHTRVVEERYIPKVGVYIVHLGEEEQEHRHSLRVIHINHYIYMPLVLTAT